VAELIVVGNGITVKVEQFGSLDLKDKSGKEVKLLQVAYVSSSQKNFPSVTKLMQENDQLITKCDFMVLCPGNHTLTFNKKGHLYDLQSILQDSVVYTTKNKPLISI